VSIPFAKAMFGKFLVALRGAAEYLCNAMQCSQPFESAYMVDSALFTVSFLCGKGTGRN